MSGSPGPGLPTRAALHETGLYLELQPIDTGELRDPFLQQTVSRLKAPNAYVQVATEDLGKAHPNSAPSGIVFHVGRCGSTLISQSLKQHGDAVVYSEPLAFNEILSLSAWPRPRIVAALRSLGDAFAAHAGGRYVLKLSSWSTLFCDVVAEAFPATPWAFNVRDPIEVGEAITRTPPPWFLGGTEPAQHITRIVDPQNDARTPELFFARLFGASCNAVARLDLSRGILVDYAALPEAIADAVAPHFALAVGDAQRTRMIGAAAHYAKAPISKPTAFTDDSTAKRAAASAQLRAAVEMIARPRLQELRRAFATR
jgi:hypothetical protein